MRTLSVFNIALVGLGLAALAWTGPAMAQTEDESQEAESQEAAIEEAMVLEAHERLIESYTQGDTETFSSLLDPSAELLIFHPRGYFQFESFPQVRKGMEHMLKRLGASEWVEREIRVVVRDEVGWVTSLILIEWEGMTEPLMARGTEVWVKRAAGWRLIHGHWSESPRRPGLH